MSTHIKASLGFTRASDAEILGRAVAVHTGLAGNPVYPNPPIDLAVFKSAVDSYSAAIADALDGGNKAITERNRQRQGVVKMLRLLGVYAETNCNDDPAHLASSGFEAASAARVGPQPLPPPSISKVEYGNVSGQLLVTVKALRALHYELRWAAAGAGGMPGPWTTLLLTKTQPAVPFNGLTPGTTYVFQVRALGRLGYSDWSDSATRMST